MPISVQIEIHFFFISIENLSSSFGSLPLDFLGLWFRLLLVSAGHNAWFPNLRSWLNGCKYSKTLLTCARFSELRTYIHIIGQHMYRKLKIWATRVWTPPKKKPKTPKKQPGMDPGGREGLAVPCFLLDPRHATHI